jgi:hypothetical protein
LSYGPPVLFTLVIFRVASQVFALDPFQVEIFLPRPLHSVKPPCQPLVFQRGTTDSLESPGRWQKWEVPGPTPAPRIRTWEGRLWESALYFYLFVCLCIGGTAWATPLAQKLPFPKFHRCLGNWFQEQSFAFSVWVCPKPPTGSKAMPGGGPGDIS